jgi:hypothetical protein
MKITPQFSQCSIDNKSYRINVTIIAGLIYLLNKTPITFHISMHSFVLLFYVILCNFFFIYCGRLCWLLTTQGQDKSQTSTFGICGGQSDSVNCTCLSTLVFRCKYHSTNAPHSYFIHILPTLYNHSNWHLCSIWHILPKYELLWGIDGGRQVMWPP